jgi:DnaK suppressor protein
MRVEPPIPDATFIEERRQTLVRLRMEILANVQGDEDEEAGINRESNGGPREYEDDAQRLANLEVDGNLIIRSLERLARVDRALKKIEEGTYGLSDVSGRPIPRKRLEAVPEATCTLDEAEALERN